MKTRKNSYHVSLSNTLTGERSESCVEVAKAARTVVLGDCDVLSLVDSSHVQALRSDMEVKEFPDLPGEINPAQEEWDDSDEEYEEWEDEEWDEGWDKDKDKDEDE